MITAIQTNKYQFWQKLATAILLFVFIFNFASVNFVLAAAATPLDQGNANAQQVLDTGGGTRFWANTFLWGLNAILTATLFLTAKLMGLAGWFFDYAFAYNFDGFIDNRGMIEQGWTISRDVANIFFILILLGIAISTILQIQSYGAKQLLAKLIIIALVINFSLPIGYIIIDFTHLLSRGFYSALVPDSQSSISGSLMNGTAVAQIFNLKEQEQSGGRIAKYALGGVLAGAAAGCAVGAGVGVWFGGIGAAPGCVVGALSKGALGGGLVAGFASWFKWGSKQSFKDGSRYFNVVMMSNILVFPLTFVFFFGGILLTIRFVVLSFLLILAPIAYISYILPDTRGKIWQKWWDEFLCQAFFMPAFMFLLYLAITFTNTWARFKFQGAVQADGSFLFNAIMITAFLISALIISKKMGCYGGGAVVSAATKGKTMLVGYTGALALRNTVGRAGEALGRQEWVQKSYGMSRAAKGMAGYSGKGIFAKPGKSRSEITSKRAEFDVAATRSKAASKQPGDFMAYTNMASKEKYVEDTLKDSKALDEFMKNSDDNAKGEFVRVARLKGGVGGEKAFNDAKRRHQLRGLKGDDLAKHFNRADQTNDGRAEDLKAMEAGQIADLLDTQSGDEQKLKTITDTVASKFEPEKQEKFYRAAMTGSSIDTAEKVYKHVPEQIRREFALRNTERTNAIFNKMKQSGNNDADLILDDIKKSGAEERYTNAGNPNRKNWMNRLGKKAELDALEKEEAETKETREVEKEFKKTQTELNKRALAQGKGGGGGGSGGSMPPPSGGGGGAPPSSGGSQIIIPPSGFGGGPKTQGTSGGAPPSSTPPSSPPPGGPKTGGGESGMKILEEIRSTEEANKTSPLLISAKEESRKKMQEAGFKNFLKRNNIDENDEAIKHEIAKVQELQTKDPHPARSEYLRSLNRALEYSGGAGRIGGSGSAIIMPSSGFGGGPKALGTSGGTPPSSTPPQSIPTPPKEEEERYPVVDKAGKRTGATVTKAEFEKKRAEFIEKYTKLAEERAKMPTTNNTAPPPESSQAASPEPSTASAEAPKTTPRWANPGATAKPAFKFEKIDNENLERMQREHRERQRKPMALPPPAPQNSPSSSPPPVVPPTPYTPPPPTEMTAAQKKQQRELWIGESRKEIEKIKRTFRDETDENTKKVVQRLIDVEEEKIRGWEKTAEK